MKCNCGWEQDPKRATKLHAPTCDVRKQLAKLPPPERNIYWRDAKAQNLPVFDLGTLWVAGTDADQAVVFWQGHEATQAQAWLRKRTQETAMGTGATKDDGKRYMIRRHFKAEGKRSKIVRRDLTLAEAKAHCNDPTSKGTDWFDGWTEQR